VIVPPPDDGADVDVVLDELLFEPHPASASAPASTAMADPMRIERKTVATGICVCAHTKASGP
jgi:hypothetical protein